MAPNSPNPPTNGREAQPGKPRATKVTLTQEQVKAIADRVYAMLLRDLMYEWERGRTAIHKSERFKGGW